MLMNYGYFCACNGVIPSTFSSTSWTTSCS